MIYRQVIRLRIVTHPFNALLLFLFFGRLSLDDAKDFVLTHDQQLLAIQFDFLTGVLTKQYDIPGRDAHWNDLAIISHLAVTGRDDFSLHGLFLGRIRNDDSADSLFAFLDASHDDAVM